MTTRTKAILSLSGVFTLGLLCGAVVVGLVVRDRVKDMESLREQEGFVRYFSDRLHLSESQRDSLKEVLAQAYDEMQSLRSAAATEYVEVFDTLKQRIAPKLSPEQREILQQQEGPFLPPGLRDRPFLKHRSRRGDRHPPPPVIEPETGREESADKPSSSLIPSARPRSDRSPKPAEVDTAGKVTTSKKGSKAVVRELASKLRDDIVAVYDQRASLTPEQREQVSRIVGKTLKRARRIREEFGEYPHVMLKKLAINARTMHGMIHEDVLTQAQQEAVPELPREVLRLAREFAADVAAAKEAQ